MSAAAGKAVELRAQREIRRVTMPLSTYELWLFSPSLAGGATPRCYSHRTELWSSPSGGPYAWVETQNDEESTHIYVARRHQPKMRGSFA